LIVLRSEARNVEAEIRDLKRRVGEIEGSFGFLVNGPDLLGQSIVGNEVREAFREERERKR
jgi:hypothetical protein